MDATPDRSTFAWPSLDAAKAFGLPIPGGEAMAGMGRAWMQEMTTLVAARLRADADAVQAIGACATLTDLAILQQRWVTEASQAYAASAHRLSRLATETPKPAEAAV